MLCRRPHHLGPQQVLSSRKISTSVYSYKKLRAFPFSISPEDAVRSMGVYAATMTGQNFWGSLIDRYLPGLGFTSVQPKRVTPVYFPGWIIDGEIHSPAKLSSGKNITLSASSTGLYLPGSDFDVLSSINFWDDFILSAQDSVPFKEELCIAYNTEVTCIPYTISPFSTLKLARNFSDTPTFREANVSLAGPVKEEMFAAYPILLPLYLAQYEYKLSQDPESPIRSLTLFTTGQRQSWTMMQRVPLGPDTDEALDFFLKTTKWGMNPNSAAVTFGPQSNFFKGQYTNPVNKVVMSANDAMLVGEGAKELAKMGFLESDDDLRVREYIPQEVNPIREYIAMVRALYFLELRTQIRSAASLPDEGLERLTEILERKMPELHSKAPEWWKQWLENEAEKKLGKVAS